MPCGCPARGGVTRGRGEPCPYDGYWGIHKTINTPSLAHPNPFFLAAIVF
jgi:hypothetical protein